MWYSLLLSDALLHSADYNRDIDYEGHECVTLAKMADAATAAVVNSLVFQVAQIIRHLSCWLGKDAPKL